MSYLAINNISKSFGSTTAVDGVSLDLELGEIVCLLGPSGCGKTTLLRLVAGLESANSGAITLDGRDLVDVPTFERGIGMMFQSYALFPHMTVAENINYGLRMAKESQGLIAERVAEMLDLVDLQGLGARRVDQLSGGQQQRVALARSLATRPGVLLLDEPLGSLDRLLRERLLDELRSILKQVGVTALYVTHDQSEAFGIADRVAVMNLGKIEQIDTPQEIYTRPKNRFVASFLGLGNVILKAEWCAGDDPLSQMLAGRLNDAQAVLIPPYGARLSRGEGLEKIQAMVTGYSFRGRFAILSCQVGEHTLEFSLDPYGENGSIGHISEPEQQIDLWLNPSQIVELEA